MWGFLASECLFFGALISSHLLYRSRARKASRFPTTSTTSPTRRSALFVLLMSSLTMVLALAAIQRGDHAATADLAAGHRAARPIFIGGQFYEFTVFTTRADAHDQLFGSCFFMLTGFHGAHVTIGILMLLSLVGMSFRGELRRAAETVEIVGLYWHFVDIVWIVIFTVVYLVPNKH